MHRLAAASTLILLLAGCAAVPAEEVPAAVVQAARGPQVLDWRQSDCQSVTWSVPVLASSLQPHLPAGFEPRTAQGPISGGQAATLGFRAVECSSGFGHGDFLRSAQSGFLFTPVIPPQELREERFAAHTSFGWDALVAAEDWRAGAAGWGLPLHDGGALVGPTAQGWTGAVSMDRVGTFTLTGRTFDGEAQAEDHESRLVTLGSQGFALWDAHVQDLVVSTGVGVWSASPESWVAQVVGATQGVATFELATWDLPHAVVHWPGQAIGPVEQGGAGMPGPDLPPH